MNKTEHSVLKALKAAASGASAIAAGAGVSYDSVNSALASLEAQGLAKVERKSKKLVELSEEGKAYAKEGTPERRLERFLRGKRAGVGLDDAAGELGFDAKARGIAMQWAVRNKWVAVEAGKLKHARKEIADNDVEKFLSLLARGKAIGSATPGVEAELRRRGLIVEKEEKSVSALVTPAGRKALAEELAESRLTPQMLRDGSWRGRTFREYDLRTVAAPLAVARKHAYKEFLQRIKLHLVGMGFKEVHGPLVEMEFWNMDALYMAQDHPAREVHDVFKVRHPGGELPSGVAERVKAAHETGLVEGSSGWRYKWDPLISAQLVLRSQTTAVSARHLATNLPSPTRLFCIGKVFRPDEIDWKHFIEFNQCEGIVLDDGMSFRELLGYLKSFALEVFGAGEVRFCPDYFPFTEPSVGMAVKLPERGWVEVGGAGMFRPEMLAALGVEHPVIAWGLGIDRLALPSVGLTDIRDLHSKDIELLRSK